MMEGYYVYVLDIVQNVQIANTNGDMIKYNNNKITVVYLQSYFWDSSKTIWQYSKWK